MDSHLLLLRGGPKYGVPELRPASTRHEITVC